MRPNYLVHIVAYT
ncbi:hypothetical protein F383_37162 [Gossypium arboreum]|uniref:Uncharacterized protein n=1 Tax=Gossypium arboreum TaxID=29729 RepID=A0A0B0M720_GOSAR|nr:hypothetical protein F383_37162 [Gossypium arboreum]